MQALPYLATIATFALSCLKPANSANRHFISEMDEPDPVVPRLVQRQAAPHTTRERIPLLSSLEGPGRAGTQTTLLGSHGSKWVGQVLAGRPHGHGQYWAPSVKPGQALQLEYEGEFSRGVRSGQGTAYFHSRGEVFSGHWEDGRRTGPGTLTYANGDVFDGMWSRDVRHGVGTLDSSCSSSSASGGSIFVGTWVQDKRQGLGWTYWPSRGKKHVAEYVDDSPTCGVMLGLEDDTVEAPSAQLRDAIAAARVTAGGLAAAAAGAGGQLEGAPQMPELRLMQPSKVLAREFVAVRQWRERQQQQLAQQRQQQGKTGPAPAAVAGGAAVDRGTGTLTANTISLLRHAFILIAGGDDVAVYVLPHQLQELVVLAGLDPAAPAVARLRSQLDARISQRGQQGKLFLDDLLEVAAFWREAPLQLGGAGGGGGGAGETAAEVWRADEEQGEGGGGGEEEAAVDMLAHHIAAHSPQAC